MIIKQYIDPIASVETLLFESFQKVFQNEEARQHFGFSRISQPTTPEGFPSWYIWFSEKRGVYSVTILDGQVIPNDSSAATGVVTDKNAVTAHLLVRYFPDINEESFNFLACSEQIFRMSDSFDATGTPSFEGGRAMHKSFFVAGHMNIIIHSSRTDADFFCFAPDRWRDYRPDGLTLTDKNGQLHEALSPGQMDRDFPGWDLSFFLFDKIISAFCFSTSQSPRFTGAATRPGVHYVIDANQNIRSAHDTDITDSILGVCFSNDAENGIAIKRQAFFAERLTANNYNISGIWNSYNDIPDNWKKPEWWMIKNRHFHMDIDHVCSCYSDH